jgi:hypothetical protein
MNIKDLEHVGDIEESTLEDELEAAIEYASDYGLAFFVVFADRSLARVGFEEMEEIMAEWRKRVAQC